MTHNVDLIVKSKEELAASRNRFVKKMVLTKIIAPIAIMTVLHFGVNYLFDKMDNAPVD